MFSSQGGGNVPQVIFHTRQDDKWGDIASDTLFRDKTVIVFSLPGAFTPTCSSSHLSRYNELAPLFYQLGVDSIPCVSVNGAFIMNAGKEAPKAEHITFIPDGNGDIPRAMNMLVDKSEKGFSARLALRHAGTQ